MFRQSINKHPNRMGLLAQFQKNRGLKKYIEFMVGVFRSEKYIELFSFFIWELRAKFGFLKYIEFTNNVGIIPNDDWSNILGNRNSQSFKISLSNYPWKMIFFTSSSSFFSVPYTRPNELLKQEKDEVVLSYTFSDEIKSFFISRNNVVFVSIADGCIYKSADAGKSFTKSLKLSHYESYFRFGYGMTESDGGELFIGEYGNVWHETRWVSFPYIYSSKDEGKTWTRNDFLRKRGVNKHIHIITYIKRLNFLLLTDGDNKKQAWIGDLNKRSTEDFVNWRLLNKLHIGIGGYTSMVDLSSKMLLGTDYNGGTNFIVETTDCKEFVKRAIPFPYRLSPIFNMQKRLAKNGIEVWCTLHSENDLKSNSLLMFSEDNGVSWNKVIEYNGAKNRIHICSTSSLTPRVLYMCVTHVSQNGEERPLNTYVIHD